MFEDVRFIKIHDDYPTPEPGAGEALVRVHYCAICGTDVKNWTTKIYQTPIVMGHEFAGEVARLGPGMDGSGFTPGDRVAGINVQLDTSSDLRGLGIFKDGGFAEYVVVPRDFLFHVPSSVAPRDATMVESFAVAVRALKWARLRDEHSVAIVGAGNIGLTTLSCLRAAGFPRGGHFVLVLEPGAFQEGKARELGASEVIRPKRAAAQRFFKDRGEPDVVFECSGSEDGLLLAMEIVKHGGGIIVESVQKGRISFPVFTLSSKEIAMRGSLSHDRQDIEDAIDLVAARRVNPAAIISSVVELDAIQEAFERYLDPSRRDFVKLIVRILG
ncbi:MAG: alcohol dehydrogenase catalytic domain-containing protein [Candidatus Lokiarchaeota archaeon]|nr:alcohol dehydrogenase catalytic domain-containing protein [Candidatus Lokiarchaeota archaeon]